MKKHGSFTDATWAPLREAVPSFADRWCAFKAGTNYDALDASMNVFEFEPHLEDDH